MKRITMVIAGLGGRGHDIYGNYAMEHPDEVEIAAVADPRPERLELAQREWNIPAERCFATAEELFAQPQLADAAVIATQDRAACRPCGGRAERGVPFAAGKTSGGGH